jgi:sulfatase modifying factor 1
MKVKMKNSFGTKCIKFSICVCLMLFAFVFTKKNLINQFDIGKLEKELCLIPGGKFKPGKEPLIKGNKVSPNAREVVKVDTFYLSNHEVTNKEYRVFLNSMKHDSMGLYQKLLPDTLIWRNQLGYNDDYIYLYLRHPAYANYPVVGVSHEQATYYCRWLTKKYNQNKKRKHQNVEFRLPTKIQWEYAAKGGAENHLATPNGQLKNKKGKWQANFQVISQFGNKIDSLKIESLKTGKLRETKGIVQPHTYSSLADLEGVYGEITCDVYSFKSSAFGLYNMAGNVSEYVSESEVIKGGSWMTTADHLMNYEEQNYNANTSPFANDRGFRVAMEIFPLQ